MKDPKFKVGENVVYKTTGEIDVINRIIPQEYSFSHRVMINGKTKNHK